MLDIAPAAAKNAGEATPTDVEAVLTTVGAGMKAMSTRYVAPTTPSGGLAAYMSSPAYLIVMHGHFVLSHARLTPGDPAPTGTVLEFVVDAHTGRADAYALSSTVATPLTKLGTVTTRR